MKYSTPDGMDEITSRTQNFCGFGVQPFGLLGTWWVETPKSHILQSEHFPSVKQFPAGRVQDTGKIAIFGFEGSLSYYVAIQGNLTVENEDNEIITAYQYVTDLQDGVEET